MAFELTSSTAVKKREDCDRRWLRRAAVQLEQAGTLVSPRIDAGKRAGKITTPSPAANQSGGRRNAFDPKGGSSGIRGVISPARNSTSILQTDCFTVKSDALAASDWHQSLARAIRDPSELLRRLGLSETPGLSVVSQPAAFPLLVPESFLARMRPGDLSDPLLRQVLPSSLEQTDAEGFTNDPVSDLEFRKAPGLLQKYAGRALLIATGSCAVHCRYCFRRNYPYEAEPRRLDDWGPALQVLREDDSIREVLLSGGDPLMLTDQRLSDLIRQLQDIPHLRRLRIHSRLPIVLPDRVTPELLNILTSTRLNVVMVVHSNHAAELTGDCAAALQRLTSALSGMVLNQAVLLRGVNDSVEALCALSERLIELRVIPCYLHQLDRVSGAAHYDVAIETGRRLISELRRRLPGYAVPRYVREIPGEPHKTVID